MGEGSAFFGKHALEIWGAGLFWSVLAIMLFKLLQMVLSTEFKFKNFKLKYWINDNILDLIGGIVISAIILRLGDYAFHVAEKGGYVLGETTDFVAWMIPISFLLQYWLHKKRLSISKQKEIEMHIHNDNCKH